MDILLPFEQQLRAKGRRPHTIRAYLSDINAFRRWLNAENGKGVLEASKLDGAQYKAHMMNDLGRKSAGINRALSALFAFYDWAFKQGIVQENPATTIHPTRQSQSNPRILEDDELERLLRIVAERGEMRDKAMFHLMLDTGLKIGELEALSVTDLELYPDAGFVIIRSNQGRRIRRVPLSRPVLTSLRAYLDIRPENGEALFISRKGGRLTANAIWKRIKQFGDAADIPELNPQMLRNTFGRYLVENHRLDAYTAAALMGYERLQSFSIHFRPDPEGMTKTAEQWTGERLIKSVKGVDGKNPDKL